ncbi:MAG: oxidoreductase [Deltaproteobacteria bacterium]|nr:oxidoreductase [Deltaproteobacteria bacterium]
MFIDVDKCAGCYNCFLACKDEFCGNDYPSYSSSQPASGHYWMRLSEIERGTYPKVKLSYVPVPCMQCEDAPCTKVSQDNAVYSRDDGIVIIDPEKAAGQKEIVASCPYEAIFWNEEKQVAQKCTFCAHLLDQGWKEPRCVETCPNGALIFGDLDDPESEISKARAKHKIEILHPEHGLKPSVCYVGLPKRFVAGEVIFGDQSDECAKGIIVTLANGVDNVETITDGFGDFEFEGLEPDTEYLIGIKHDGYAPEEFNVKTNVDVNLGEIVLTPV